LCVRAREKEKRETHLRLFVQTLATLARSLERFGLVYTSAC
jgi:hypothetical protein